MNPTDWTAVAFVLFVIAIFKPAKNFILSGLDAKIDEIRSQVEEAQQLREEAQALLATYQRQQREALKEAEEIVDRAEENASRMRTEAKNDLDEAIKRQETIAREKIAQAEAAAIARVQSMAVNLAISATEKILMERLTGKAGKGLIDNAIGDLPNKLQ
ncbi:MAG: F0F1 ATP synthase subunit B [Rhodospirillaceae bacterium]|nr:F0F1 ATP synthase subunit B [Rhodospirillaceae bacterium]